MSYSGCNTPIFIIAAIETRIVYRNELVLSRQVNQSIAFALGGT